MAKTYKLVGFVYEICLFLSYDLVSSEYLPDFVLRY